MSCPTINNSPICPCMEICPMKFAMSILGGKWKMAIWCALWTEGPLRYNELKRKINGITNTMLASSLKELEQYGVVKRIQYNEIPVRVEYSLTPKNETLAPAIEIICNWGKEMIQENEKNKVNSNNKILTKN